MENGKWKMEHGKSSPVYSETPSPLGGGRLFSAARRATFSAPSRRKGLARYVDRNENFVLVATVSSFCRPWAFRRGLPTITAKDALIVATQARDIKGKALG
jgi:hypothetical protein